MWPSLCSKFHLPKSSKHDDHIQNTYGEHSLSQANPLNMDGKCWQHFRSEPKAWQRQFQEFNGANQIAVLRQKLDALGFFQSRFNLCGRTTARVSNVDTLSSRIFKDCLSCHRVEENKTESHHLLRSMHYNSTTNMSIAWVFWLRGQHLLIWSALPFQNMDTWPLTRAH